MGRHRFAMTWPHNAIVSKTVAGRLMRGRVVKWRRERDGEVFVMVRPEWPAAPGVQQPDKVWPEGWMLGAGEHVHECVACDQPYRTDDTASDFCEVCRPPEDGRGHDSRSVRATLRGARGYGAGTHAVRPMTADERRAWEEQKAKDDAESPF